MEWSNSESGYEYSIVGYCKKTKRPFMMAKGSTIRKVPKIYSSCACHPGG